LAFQSLGKHSIVLLQSVTLLFVKMKVILASIALLFVVALPSATFGQPGDVLPCKTDPLSARGFAWPEEPRGFIQ
jgi:hypothetical protein